MLALLTDIISDTASPVSSSYCRVLVRDVTFQSDTNFYYEQCRPIYRLFVTFGAGIFVL